MQFWIRTSARTSCAHRQSEPMKCTNTCLRDRRRTSSLPDRQEESRDGSTSRSSSALVVSCQRPLRTITAYERELFEDSFAGAWPKLDCSRSFRSSMLDSQALVRLLQLPLDRSPKMGVRWPLLQLPPHRRSAHHWLQAAGRRQAARVPAAKHVLLDVGSALFEGRPFAESGWHVRGACRR